METLDTKTVIRNEKEVDLDLIKSSRNGETVYQVLKWTGNKKRILTASGNGPVGESQSVTLISQTNDESESREKFESFE